MRGNDHGQGRPMVKTSAPSIWMLWRREIKEKTKMEKIERYVPLIT